MEILQVSFEILQHFHYQTILYQSLRRHLRREREESSLTGNKIFLFLLFLRLKTMRFKT